MPLRRFQFLLKYLYFDGLNTKKEERHLLDGLATIREIFSDFNNACEPYFTPSEFLTIDEMLEQFRGWCTFHVCMRSKSAKYGLKSFALVDAKYFYAPKLEIYTG